MPKIESEYIHTKKPFSAEILVREESHAKYYVKDNGYQTTPIQVEGGIIAKISVSALSLSELEEKISAHVALIS